MKFKLAFLLPVLLLLPGAAQQPPAPTAAPEAYHIQITIVELQAGKAPTRHTFDLTAAPGHMARLQAGNKVPVRTAVLPAGAKESGYQFTYEPVGTNILCTLPKTMPAGKLSLGLTVQVSAVVAAPNGLASADPVFRNADGDVNTVVPLGKPTIVARFGDVASGLSYQLEVLATPLP